MLPQSKENRNCFSTIAITTYDQTKNGRSKLLLYYMSWPMSQGDLQTSFHQLQIHLAKKLDCVITISYN